MSFDVVIGYSDPVAVDYTVFSGGEIHLQLPHSLTSNPLENRDVPSIAVYARDLKSSDDIMALVMFKDAISREFPTVDCKLEIGYLPYARQDRVCNRGEAFSSKAFANLINGLGFSEVLVMDPHSDVGPALLHNVTDIWTQSNIINDFEELVEDIKNRNLLLISPDAGAIKKSEELAREFSLELVQGTKKRNLATGELSGFGVHDPDNLIQGRHCLIADDICDGGGTFVGLAKVLLEKGAESVSLYVTHGIFSRGIENLLDNGIDKVYTTSTFNSGEVHDRLITMQL